MSAALAESLIDVAAAQWLFRNHVTYRWIFQCENYLARCFAVSNKA